MRTYYTTITQLRDTILNDNHLVACIVDRSGALITDSDVVRLLDNFIYKESRLFDGYLRGFLEVPIQPTVTSLTGSITMVNGSRVILGVGTLFLTELEVGMEIRLDDEDNCRVIISSISTDLEAICEDSYYGTLLTGTFSKYVGNIPEEISGLISGHLGWKLWQKDGRYEENNPFASEEAEYRRLAKEIRKGNYRFDTAVGEEITTKPSYYNTDVNIDDAVMSDSNLGGYIP